MFGKRQVIEYALSSGGEIIKTVYIDGVPALKNIGGGLESACGVSKGDNGRLYNPVSGYSEYIEAANGSASPFQCDSIQPDGVDGDVAIFGGIGWC